MNDPSQNQPPALPPPTPEQLAAAPSTAYTADPLADLRRSNKLKLTWGLICLTGPVVLTAIGIVLIFVTFVLSFQLAWAGSSSSTLSALAIIAYAVGGTGAVTFLPGLVVGIILLSRRQKLPPQY